MLTAAKLAVVVTADTRQAELGLLSLSAKAKAFAAQAAAVHAGALITVGAIAAIGAAAVITAHQAADFQGQLVRLVTDAGESASNLDMVRQGILKMATDTGTATDQLTTGMYYVESGGYHGAKALEILTAAAKGAKVGYAELGTMANATTTLLTDFGTQAGTATNVVNALIATVSHGKTTLEELAGSLAMVAPAAAAAHVHMNDMLAAMATMTGEGVPAAESATYLRQMIIQLSAPSSEAKNKLKELGLTTQQVSDAMQRSLPDALKLIYSHITKFYKEGSPQYMDAIRTISGGLRQMQAMVMLGGDHLKTLGDNLQLVTAQVKAGGGEVENWNTVQGNFNQKVAKAGAAIQVLAITIGSHLLPVFGKIVEKFTPLVTGLAAWVVQLAANKEQLKQWAPVGILVAGILGGLLVAALTSLAITAWAAILPFLAFAAPFVAVGAAIAGLVLLIKSLNDHFHWWKDAMDPVNATLKFLGDNSYWVNTILLGLAAGIAAVTLPMVVGLIPAFWGWATAAGAAAVATIIAAWPVYLVIAAVALLVIGIKLLIEHWSDVVAFLGGVWAAVVGTTQMDLAALGAAFQWLGDIIGAAGRAIAGVASWIGGAIMSAFAAVGAAFQWLYDHNHYVRELVAAVQERIAALGTFLQSAFANIVAGVQVAWGLFQTYIIGPVSAAWDWIRQTFGAIGTWIADRFGEAVAAAKQKWVDFLNVIGALKDTVGKFVQDNIIKPIVDKITSLGSKLLGLGGQIMAQLFNGIVSAIKRFANTGIRGVGNILSFLGFDQSVIDSLPHFAAGGVSAGGLAVVGERGPEIVNLPAGASVLPNPQTRQLMGSGSQQPIVVQLVADGRKLAEVVVRHTPSVIHQATGIRSM
jgi:TP901 family phage tail tape measure protein